MIKETKVLISI